MNKLFLNENSKKCNLPDFAKRQEENKVKMRVKEFCNDNLMEESPVVVLLPYSLFATISIIIIVVE
jgi:hypothetical protein